MCKCKVVKQELVLVKTCTVCNKENNPVFSNFKPGSFVYLNIQPSVTL